MPNKKFTVSTYIFDSLKEAKEQINDWQDENSLNPGTKVFEIKAVYTPKFTLVKEKSHGKD
jgi:hypothetical protein